MKLGTSTNMFNCRRGSLAKPTYAEMTAAAADAGFDVIDIDLSGASSACTSDELASDGWEAAIDAAGEAAAKRGAVDGSVQPLYLHPRQTAGRR